MVHINIILLLASAFLYIISPYGVNMIYIYIALCIFLLGSFDVLKNEIKNKNYLTFNLIFLVAFFSVTYLFPIAILDTELDVRQNQALFVDFNYITQAVSLSTVAICCYFIGYNYIKGKPWKGKVENVFMTSKYNQTATYINLFLAVSVVANALFYITQNTGSINITESPFLNQIYVVSLAIVLVSSRSKKASGIKFNFFLARNRLVLVASSLVMLIFLYVGDRGLPIQLMLCILAAYSFYYSKLKFSSLVALGLVGILVMFALRVTRNTSESISRAGVSAAANATQESLNGTSSVVLLADLYGASQELCLGYEYTTTVGLSDPAQIITLPFTPIPKLPTILNQLLFHKTPFEMSSGYILNQYMSRYSSSAFGSHCVIDIFMKWGIIGVVCFFLLFGCVIAYIENGSNRTMFCTVMLVIINGFALYMPRDSIIDIIRPMFYVIALMWLCGSLAHQKRKKMVV